MRLHPIESRFHGLRVILTCALILMPEFARLNQPSAATICDPGGPVCTSCKNQVQSGITSTMSSIIVGTPRGMLASHPGGYLQHLRNLSGSNTPAGHHVWLAFRYLDGPSTNVMMALNDESGQFCSDCNGIVSWPYCDMITDSNGEVTVDEGFSGAGDISFEFEFDCRTCGEPLPGPAYYDFGPVVAMRSTDRCFHRDLAPDGDTDEWDKINLGYLLKHGGTDPSYDLDVDGDVDADDYAIEATEEALETSIHPFCTSQHPDSTGLTPDATAPSAVSLSKTCDGGSWVISWTAPGDVTYNGEQLGRVQYYDLRYSSSPITSANFGSATPYSTPTPALAGTTQSVSVGVTAPARYWALKSVDWRSRASSVSGSLSIVGSCEGTSMRPQSDEDAAPNRFEVKVLGSASRSTSDPLTLRFSTVEERSLTRLGIYDASGRLVRSLTDRVTDAGTHTAVWDLKANNGENVKSGVYFARLSTGDRSSTATLVVVY